MTKPKTPAQRLASARKALREAQEKYAAARSAYHAATAAVDAAQDEVQEADIAITLGREYTDQFFRELSTDSDGVRLGRNGMGEEDIEAIEALERCGLIEAEWSGWNCCVWVTDRGRVELGLADERF